MSGLFYTSWKNARDQTYRKQRSSVKSQLDNLDGSIVASLDGRICWQWDLRQAERARVRVLAGTDDLEGGNHGEAHVLWAAAGSICSEAQVHVQEGGRVALEPAWLKSNGTTCCWPVRPVRRCVHSTT